MGSQVKVYVSKIELGQKGGPVILLSRSHYGFVKRLLEKEIPELNDGTVILYSVAREAGQRSKIAVYSENPNVDAVGAEDAQHDDVHVVPPVYASLHSTDPTEVDRGAIRTTAHLRDERHEATEPGEGVLRFAQNATQETRCDSRHQRSRWERDGGGLVLRPVGLHQREGGYTGDDQLVSPAQLQDVVHKPQQRHQTDGENRSVVVRHLGVRIRIVGHLLIGLCTEHFVDDERQNLNRSRHNSQGFRTNR